MPKEAPFVDVNCAAITANLFESEFFGYDPGAFTGSLTKGQKGKFDLAQGGTLFLVEVGDIPLELQGKLLKAIQEKEFYCVGGLKKCKTDIRIICATNSNLEQKVKQGTFRKDLYYRLKVGHFIIPLTEMFLRQFAGQKASRFQKISKSAAKILLDYEWSGNVRELRNILEWVSLMYNNVELKPEHLSHLRQEYQISSISGNEQTAAPAQFVLPASGFDLDEYNDQIIQQAGKVCNGNKTAAALRLGISRRTLIHD